MTLECENDTHQVNRTDPSVFVWYQGVKNVIDPLKQRFTIGSE